MAPYFSVGTTLGEYQEDAQTTLTTATANFPSPTSGFRHDDSTSRLAGDGEAAGAATTAIGQAFRAVAASLSTALSPIIDGAVTTTSSATDAALTSPVPPELEPEPEPSTMEYDRDVIQRFFQNATRSTLSPLSTLDMFVGDYYGGVGGGEYGGGLSAGGAEEAASTGSISAPALERFTTATAAAVSAWGTWGANLTMWSDAGDSTTGDYNLTTLDPDAGSHTPASLALAVIAGLTLGTICIMTIGGNVLVLLAVFVNSHLRSTTNYFIVNLAIADLLLGTTVLPFSASLEVVNYWAFGQVFCDIWAAVDVMCCTASIMSLCVISIDRYIGVTRPLQHSTIMTEKRAFYIIVLVWVLAMTISIAPLLGWKEPPPDDPTVCEVTMQIGYVLFSVSGSFYIPLIIILVVYFRVYREAMSQTRFLATGVKVSRMDESNSEVTLRIHTGRAQPNTTKPGNPYQSSSSSEHSEGSGKKNHSKLTMAGKVAKFKREKKAAKTLGIVVGVFILCWFPFFFILPLESLCESCNIPQWLFKIIFWLGYCNSLMNPIIYACSSREFKRAFTRILMCRWRRKPRSFIDELSQSAPSTEMSGLSRLASVRNISFRSKKRDTLRRTYSCSMGGAGRRFLLQATNGRTRLERESPIASLRLLHNQQRHDVADGRAGGDDSTDDERSVGSGEDACAADDVDAGPLAAAAGGARRHMGAIDEAEQEGHFTSGSTSTSASVTVDLTTVLGDHQLMEIETHQPATEHHVTSRQANRKRQKFRSEQRATLPDIVIDDAEMEPLNVSIDASEKLEARFVKDIDLDTMSCFHNSVDRSPKHRPKSPQMTPKGRSLDSAQHPHQTIQSDNIMWL